MSHRYLVLGLLSEGPMTGYEIKKYVGSALRSVTNASYGTLYPTLHRLLDEGAVHMEEYPQNHRPARKVYRITSHGQRELADWLQQPSGKDQVRREFLLKLFMASNLAPEKVRAMLLERRAATEETLAELQQMHSIHSGSTAQNKTWVCEYTIAMCHTELDWLDRLIAQMKAEPR